MSVIEPNLAHSDRITASSDASNSLAIDTKSDNTMHVDRPLPPPPPLLLAVGADGAVAALVPAAPGAAVVGGAVVADGGAGTVLRG